MCARRFLILVFILILVVVAAAFAIFQFGGNVLIRQATPKGHFEPADAGRAPDYREPDAWLARPDLAHDPSRWLPNGVDGAQSGDAAVFYIHPTTYLLTDRWNAPMHPDVASEGRTQLFVRSQASAFNGAGRIWAPRYRQAAYGAFLLKSDDATKALDFAYADVKAAFDEFLRQVPKDRPLILAGHSQGALHLSRLLVDRGARVSDRLIGAYVVGWPLSVTADVPATGLPICTAADQPGCILSWQTYREPANPEFLIDAWAGTRGPTGTKRDPRDMLCVSPLTGLRDSAGPANPSAGTLVPSADFTTATLANGLSARCDEGLLIVEGELPALGPFVLPGNNYHAYDYALFWGAIRADAERRLSAWSR